MCMTYLVSGHVFISIFVSKIRRIGASTISETKEFAYACLHFPFYYSVCDEETTISRRRTKYTDGDVVTSDTSDSD